MGKLLEMGTNSSRGAKGGDVLQQRGELTAVLAVSQGRNTDRRSALKLGSMMAVYFCLSW